MLRYFARLLFSVTHLQFTLSIFTSESPVSPISISTSLPSKMGAWGYGLFQSDYDYDIVADLSAECGLDKLQSDAEAKSEGSESTSEDAAPEFYYSLYCPSDVEVVREHLETPGAATGVSPLDSALSKWEAKAFGKRPKYEYPDSGYAFVLLGACESSHDAISRQIRRVTAMAS